MHLGLEAIHADHPRHQKQRQKIGTLHQQLVQQSGSKKMSKSRQERIQEMESARHRRKLHRFCSLTAALVLPFVYMFSIPGLTEHWYIRKDAAGVNVQSQPDPTLIVVSGSVSLALAILANLFLVLRLIETHPRFCTFTGMICLILMVIVNLVALILFGIRAHRYEDGYVLSTAFSVTAAATAIAFSVLILFFVDAIPTQWYKRGGTGLSGKQRSLVIAFEVFIATVCVGAVVNKYLNDFPTFLDSIYFVIQTVITTGFGDLTPTTTGGQIFGIIFDAWGILTFAVVVAFTRSTALEAMQNEYKYREQVVLKRLRNRHRLLHRDRSRSSTSSIDVDSWYVRISRKLHFTSNKGQAPDEEEERQVEAERKNEEDQDGEDVELNEKDYEAAILELQKERGREFRSEAIVSAFIFFTTWVVGAAVYQHLEGWSFFVSFYFVFISFSTIGYGDYSPTTPASRAFFSAFALVGAGVTTVFFSVLADAYTARYKETFQRSWFTRAMLRIHDNADTRQVLEEEERQNGIRPGASLEHTEEVQPAEGGENSQRPKESEHVDEKVRVEKRSDSTKLLELVKETRMHISDLILHDGGSLGGSGCVERVVKQVMDDQNFATQSRIEVMSDENMKRFICRFHLDGHVRQNPGFESSVSTQLGRIVSLIQDSSPNVASLTDLRKMQSDLDKLEKTILKIVNSENGLQSLHPAEDDTRSGSSDALSTTVEKRISAETRVESKDSLRIDDGPGSARSAKHIEVEDD